VLMHLPKRTEAIKKPQKIIRFFQESALELLTNYQARDVPRMLRHSAVDSLLCFGTVDVPGYLDGRIKEKIWLSGARHRVLDPGIYSSSLSTGSAEIAP
jgi:hypothetical protein